MLFYLKTFSLGEEPSIEKGFNINNGISLSKTSLDLIKEIIMIKINKNHCELIELAPQSVIIQ